MVEQDKKMKDRTRAKTRALIKSGQIKEPSVCALCFQPRNLQAHHHDYSLPMEVAFLCVSCHSKLHTYYERKQTYQRRHEDSRPKDQQSQEGIIQAQRQIGGQAEKTEAELTLIPLAEIEKFLKESDCDFLLIRKSLKMQEEDFVRLKEIAKETGSIYSGKPSWRRLLVRIARGEFDLEVDGQRICCK